jgi:hypothetical protein
MSVTFAHVAGIPLEETLATFAPLACAIAALARARLGGIRRWRPPLGADRRLRERRALDFRRSTQRVGQD